MDFQNVMRVEWSGVVVVNSSLTFYPTDLWISHGVLVALLMAGWPYGSV